MPHGRPAIPRDIEREVLVEAGHRCAVCGVPCPLERAHIVAWAMTKEHTAENLVCLCANCHSRADHEKWGAETLRKYKARPWVLRRRNGEAPAKATQTVLIELDLSLDAFDHHSQDILRYALAGLLQISPERVRFSDVKRGSVKVFAELPGSAARELVEIFAADSELVRSHLPIFTIRSIEFLEASGFGEVTPSRFSASYPIPDKMVKIINNHTASLGVVGVGGGLAGPGSDLPVIAASWVALTLSLATEAGHELSPEMAKEVSFAVATGVGSVLVGTKAAMTTAGWISGLFTTGASMLLSAAGNAVLNASFTRVYGKACARYFLQAKEIDSSEDLARILIALIGREMRIDMGFSECLG